MKLIPNFHSQHLTYSVMKFPSGEIQVKLEPTITEMPVQITLEGSVLSSDHLVELLQLVEAIKFEFICNISLTMPYCAYSRQDRRCNEGESMSLKVFANLINSCEFDRVTTWDNHSDVATGLIDNCYNKPVTDIFYGNKELDLRQYDYFISPDAGSNKKVFNCSTKFNIPMIRADKVRDTATGSILSTDVFTTSEQLANKTVLIIDDICAGGRTFVELAKALKAIEPSVTIHLYVTHGFFSHKDGLNYILENNISKVITTDSVIYHNYEEDVTCGGDVIIL